MPLSALPAVTVPVTIDGYTQPGATPFNPLADVAAALLIEISGASLDSDISGLTIAGGNSTVRGLVINRFVTQSSNGGAGIALSTNGGDRVEGNYLGTDPTGTMAEGNTLGVLLLGARATRSAARRPPLATSSRGTWATVWSPASAPMPP